MNKKTLLFAAGVLVATGTFAQKAKLNEATKELDNAQAARMLKQTDKEAEAYQKAKAAIDLAAADEATKGNSKTWFTKAAIYIGMQENESLNADKPYRQGVEALKQAFTLDKKLENDSQTPNLVANSAFYFYNDGIQTYNSSQYGEAFNLFKEGASLLGADKDKRFSSMPIVDTIRAQSKMFMGYTAFYDQKFEEAVPLLKEAKSSPYLASESNIYLILSQAYDKMGKKDDQLAILKEAKTKFPGDKNIDNAELNYYIASGKQDEMTGKLEEAIAKDPANPELYINLGIVYAGMAYPPRGTAAPANSAELGVKAETAYKKAVELAPDNGTYNYQLGAFYFNQAADVNTNMSNLGTGKADQAKYNTMLTDRNSLFAKSLPLLEKSKDIFSANSGKLANDQKRFYRDGLNALRQIYIIQDEAEKIKDVKAKLAALEQ